MIGRKYGRLTVLEFDGLRIYSGRRRSFYKCRCDCGIISSIVGSSLKTGHTTSCGCLREERALKAVTKHGHTYNSRHSRTYNSWVAMHSRCERKSHEAYPRYGGRGITVCARWSGFANFLADMGKRPDGKTLDRINNEGNYESKNCRWATPKEQQANTRRWKATAEELKKK